MVETMKGAKNSVQPGSILQTVAMRGEQVQDGVTDIVTCGGLQSAHTAAFAAAAAEAGMRAHLAGTGFPLPHPLLPSPPFTHARALPIHCHQFSVQVIYHALMTVATPGQLLPVAWHLMHNK